MKICHVEENQEYPEYPNPWRYNGVPFDGSLIRDFHGFVYNITNLANQRQYIGRKYFWQRRKPRPTDSNPRPRRVTSESDWRKYYGSCPELKEDVKRFGKESFRRTILSLHKTPGKVNYEETRQLFLNNVLTESLTDGTPTYYNSNVLGRYYKKDYYDFGNDSGT